MSRDALIVGISSYQHLPSLNAPAHDAEAIAHQLETYGDFRVARLPEIVHTDAQAEKKLRVGVKTPVTIAELEAALVKLFKPKGSNIPQTALFYFSGHGLQKEAGIREGYLATSEANPNSHFYGLSLFWLRRLLEESPVRQRIVLLDCCNSGEILNFQEADPGAKSGIDRLFMAAAREYESAYESLNGQYSVFTQALLNGLDPRRLSNGVITNYALTDWVSNSLKGESQQPLFENSGSEIILTRCQNPLTSLYAAPVEDICPYRGLEPFDEAHAEYFFGREHLTDQLLDKIKNGNFLAVVGASGSGKSSLVRAGLTYRLQRGQKLSGSNHWQIRLITPTEHPIKSLADAFINTDASPIERAEQLRRAEILLQEGGTGLAKLIRASLMSAQSKTARMVLIIDQFEEVFTLCQGPHAERDRHRFFNCLLSALKDVGDCFSVVVVLRADFFSKCSLYKGLAEQIEQNLVMVTPLSYDQIKASITKPAEKVGLSCDPNLVYNILLDIVGAPGELPLLQYTLLELWHRRRKGINGEAPCLTLDAYTELGGVRGTLQKRADEIFYSLTEEEQQVAKRIFIALTQLGEGTEDTRRRVLKSELVSPQTSSDLVERVLEKLVVAKLVVTNQITPASHHRERVDQRLANMSTALRIAQVVRSKSPQFANSPNLARLSNATALQTNVTRISQVADLDMLQIPLGDTCQETVDIAHEALIRNWFLLRSWLDENREMLRRQRRIERAAREWQTGQQLRSSEYLLNGSRLLDAEDYLSQYPNELSPLALKFVAVSREESLRTRRELRMLQVSIPMTLVVALGITFYQYQVAMQNQNEKDYQLRVATSRQWSAIAQSILQEPDGDPMTALLISRLAAERGHTLEAEASLRNALQALRLQANLKGHEGVVEQVAFSPDGYHFATIEQTGTVRIWSLRTRRVKHVLTWKSVNSEHSPVETENTKTANFFLVFTPDGKSLIAAHANSSQARIWSTNSGELQANLEHQSPITQMTLSPDGAWLATAGEDHTVRIWKPQVGQQQAQIVRTAPIQQLAFTKDSQSLMIADTNTLSLWQTSSGRNPKNIPQAKPLTSALLSPNGDMIAVASQDGVVSLWDMATGKQHQRLVPFHQQGAPKRPLQLKFSPNGQYLAISGDGGQAEIWNWRIKQHWPVGQPIKLDSAAQTNPVMMSFSPDSRLVIVARQNQLDDQTTYLASIWDLHTNKSLGALHGHTDVFTALEFSADGSLIATASQDGAVRLWTTHMGSEFPSLRLVNEPLQWVSFQEATVSSTLAEKASAQFIPPAGELSATGESRPMTGVMAVSTGGVLHKWDLGEPRSLTNQAPESFGAEDVEMSGNSLSPAKQAINTLKELRNYLKTVGHQIQAQMGQHSNDDGQQSTTDSLQQSDTSSQLVGVTPINTSAEPEKSALNLATHVTPGAKFASIAFSSNGQLVVISDTLGKVDLWQIQPDRSLKLLHRLQEAGKQVPDKKDERLTSIIRQLAFSPDNQKLIGVGTDWALRVWEVPSGKLMYRLSGHEAFVEQAHFSPNSQQVVSVSWDRTARIWDVNSGKMLSLFSHQDALTSARFSPDGQRIVVTSLDSTARVFNVHEGTTQVILAGHRGAVLDAEFSPNGHLIVTASADGTAKVWDAKRGTEKAQLRPADKGSENDSLRRVFFSPDGQLVATLNGRGQLDLWTANWQDLLDLARDRSLRQIKPEECLQYLRLPPNLCPALQL
jgi:WD40 repeat protein